MRWLRRRPAPLFEDDIYSFRERRRLELSVRFDRAGPGPSRWVVRLCQGIALTLACGLLGLLVLIAGAIFVAFAGI